MKFEAKEIVVDADIARASGTTEHPISKSARIVLQVILDTNIIIVFCPALLDEWKKHRSQFATKWLSSMIAKKKFFLIKPKSITAEQINLSGIGEEQRAIALKDAHVVDIALVSSKLIASNDATARKVFCEIALASAAFDNLFWIIPREDGNAFVDIISNRGYMHPKWLVRCPESQIRN